MMASVGLAWVWCGRPRVWIVNDEGVSPTGGALELTKTAEGVEAVENQESGDTLEVRSQISSSTI